MESSEHSLEACALFDSGDEVVVIREQTPGFE